MILSTIAAQTINTVQAFSQFGGFTKYDEGRISLRQTAFLHGKKDDGHGK